MTSKFIHFVLCVCVVTPQSPHCGDLVGGQHWETSASLGWTGPFAGLTASRHNGAERHKWSQDTFNSTSHSFLNNKTDTMFKDCEQMLRQHIGRKYN